jgi:uncharacterized protein with HEPN domain
VRDDSVYLRHIAQSLHLLQQYLTRPDRSWNEELFSENQLIQDAVLRRLETLADAASHLSDKLKARHPEIPWRQVADFRNVLAHGYADIRLDRVWQVIVADLPALKAAVDEEFDHSTSP